MDEKLSVREYELNDIKGKCVQNELTLDGSEKQIIRLRKERELNEVEMKHYQHNRKGVCTLAPKSV